MYTEFSPRLREATFKHAPKAWLAAAALALSSCSSTYETTEVKYGCKSVSGILEPGQELNPGKTEKGTSVTLVNLFGSNEDNYSAVVIETKDTGVSKEVAVVDFAQERVPLPTGETLTASTLPTETDAVDGYIKICPPKS